MLETIRSQAGAFMVTVIIVWLASPAIAEASILFEARLDYRVGYEPRSVAIGYLDEDGHPEPGNQRVNGSIRYHNGHRIVNLWGTHYEMGYAHGYLLGDEIMMALEDYILVAETDPTTYTNEWIPFVENWYFQLLPDDYDQEITGMLQGMTDAGTDLFIESLGREMEFVDVLAGNLLFDLRGIQCSSTFGWGGATADDPELQGGPAIAHNNDSWINHPFTDEHSIILVFQSASPDEKGFVAISYPGNIQVSNGFNLDGVGAFSHGSNHGGYDLVPLYGIGFAIRDGLEDKDFDGDGYETYLDVYQAVSTQPVNDAHNLGLISPDPVPGQPGLDPAAILEMNHWAHALRGASHNMDYTPFLNSLELLAVTNHFRLLYPPTYCSRYNYQVNQLSIDFKVDTDELWQIQSGVAHQATIQMMAFRPNLLDVYVAFNETGQGAHNSQKNYYRLNDLFIPTPRPLILVGPGPVENNPPLVRVFPPEQNAEHDYQFAAYGPQHHGVHVSCGDMDSDGYDEIITGAGPGAIYGPHVRGFDVDGTPLPGLSFLAYGTRKWGVKVAAGDIDNDGYDEIITGAGPGAVFGPQVRAFDYDGTPSVIPVPGVSFFAYGVRKWGVNISSGDIDGDGFDEIITGPGPGAVFGPHVRGWDVDGGPATAIPGISFFAYRTREYGAGVTCGNLDGDGFDEIVTGPGPGEMFGTHVRGWNYDDITVTPLPGCSFLAWQSNEIRYGAKVFAGADLDHDGGDDLVVGCGPDPVAGTEVRAFRYDGAQVTGWFSFNAFPGMTQGTNVAAGRFLSP